MRAIPILKNSVKGAIAPPAVESGYRLPDPQPGGQTIFASTDADIAIFGGAAGAGKSLSLLCDAAKYIDNPKYGAVIFRVTSPEITNEGGLWDESKGLYTELGGRDREHLLDWRFPSGSAISFGHTDKLKQKYPGAQIAYIGLDELASEGWTSDLFWFLLSRNRSTSGVKPVVRATCNPNADSFLADLVAWWIDQETGYPIPERRGVIRWLYRISEEIFWGDTKEELEERFPEQAAIAPPKSFTFIYGTIYENKALLDANPQYLANLLALHPVEMERLLKGNWKVRFEAGTIFNRNWFEVVDWLPGGAELCKVRFWDFASTAASMATSTSYYSASTKWVRIGDIDYILDCYWEQVGGGNDDSVKTLAEQDGAGWLTRWELEGGSAASRYEARLQEDLAGFDACGVKPLGDKVTRAIPWARRAQQGKIKLLRGAWNDQFLSAVHNFDGKKRPLINDIVDSGSGAYSVIEAEVRRSPVSPPMVGSKKLAKFAG
jgi:phage terminase large subunit-like protein